MAGLGPQQVADNARATVDAATSASETTTISSASGEGQLGREPPLAPTLTATSLRPAFNDIAYVLGMALGSILGGGAVGWLAAGKFPGAVIGAGGTAALSSVVELLRNWSTKSTVSKVGLATVALAGVGVTAYGLHRRGRSKAVRR